MRAKKLIDACADADAAMVELRSSLGAGKAGAVAAHAEYGNGGGKATNVALTGQHWSRIVLAGREADFWTTGSVDLPQPKPVKLTGIKLDSVLLNQLRQEYGAGIGADGKAKTKSTMQHGLPIAHVVIEILRQPPNKRPMSAKQIANLLRAEYAKAMQSPPHDRNLETIASGIMQALKGVFGQLPE